MPQIEWWTDDARYPLIGEFTATGMVWAVSPHGERRLQERRKYEYWTSVLRLLEPLGSAWPCRIYELTREEIDAINANADAAARGT